MTAISLVEDYKIVDSLFEHFEGNFLGRIFCKKLLESVDSREFFQ